MPSPFATTAGTANYRDRFRPAAAAGHFRLSQGLWMSSIGLGTYLGHYDDRTDEAYGAAIRRAAELGCNVFDTAANYRFQRSERAIGDALAALFAAGELAREEVIVATKGGYLPFDSEPPRARDELARYLEETFIRPGICEAKDFVRGSHCMTPRYLSHQLDQSLRNLRLEAVDIYYLHNPEAQLASVDREEFYARLRAAFEMLEAEVERGRIARYGTATWNAYRVGEENPEFLSLERVIATAREVAGEAHHCRVVQLPINLEMNEALRLANQLHGRATLLAAARELGVTIMASASLMQARLAASGESRSAFSSAQQALQFSRSMPGVTTALVGMSRLAHVEENLALAVVPPLEPEKFDELFPDTPGN